MKQLVLTAVLALVLVSAVGAHEGCEKPAPSAKAKTQAVPKKGLCAPCIVKEGRRSPEAVKAHFNYKGKRYTFCSPGCKAEFVNRPAKYAGAVK